MTPANDTAITVRMETGQPNSGHITVHTEPENAEDLRQVFNELGLSTTDDIFELSVPEILTTAFAVTGIVSSQLFVFAKALSLWFHRHDGKKIEITMNDRTLKLEGMSVAEATRMMHAAQQGWDDKWRDQFPDRFPFEIDE
jgi:hypothetical protein